MQEDGQIYFGDEDEIPAEDRERYLRELALESERALEMALKEREEE